MHYFRRFRARHGSFAPETNDVTNYKGERIHSLSDAREGGLYTLAAFQMGQGLKEKIFSMGLNSGTKFKILLNSGHGPVEVEVRQTRLGIGRGMAQQIRVREVE